MKLLALLLLCCVCGNSFAQQFWQQPDAARSYLDTLSAKIDQSRYAEVAAECSRVIQYFSGIKKKEQQLIAAQAWSVKGNALLQGGDATAAIDCHQRARTIRSVQNGPASIEVAYSLHNIGNCYLLAQAYPEAEKWLLKSLKIKQLYPGNNDGTTAESLGNVYLRTDRPEKAAEMFRLALQSYGVNNSAAVNTHLSLANFFRDQSLPDSVLICLDKAKALCDGQPGCSAEKRAVIADSRGACLTDLGRYEEAVTEFRQALDLFFGLSQVKPAKLGRCLKNTGDVFLEIGDLETALGYYRQAAQVFPDQSFEMAGVLNSMGLVHFGRDDLDAAVETFRSAVKILLEISTPAGRNARAAAFSNLGGCLMQSQKYEAAVYYYEQAITDFEVLQDWKGQLTTGSRLGYCLMLSGAGEAAEHRLRNLLHKVRSTSPEAFPVYYRLGKLLENKKLYSEAKDFYQKALECAGAAGPFKNVFPEESALAYTALARIWYKSGATAGGEQALAFTDAAIELAESVKQLSQSNPGAIEIQNNLSEPFNLAVDICLKLADKNGVYNEYAFIRAERYKANFLRRTTLRSFYADMPELEKELGQVEKAITAIQKAQFESLHTGQTLMADNQDKLGRLLQRQAALKKEIEKQLPSYYQSVYQYNIPGVHQIRQQLNDKQVLVEFQWTDEQIAVFIISRDSFIVKSIHNTDSVSGCISRLWDYYTQSPTLIPSLQADSIHRVCTQSSNFLFKTLLGDIAVSTGQTLLIVPDNLLCYLPFEALISRPATDPSKHWLHRYLNDDFTVLYGPSAGTFRQNQVTGDVAMEPLSGFAPVFHSQTQLDSLENNGKEVSAVQKVTGGAVFTGDAASKSAFLQEAGQHKVLLLSTHGILNNRRPEFSFLAFSRSSDTSDYERLYVSEIYQLKTSTDLVVISACHSAGGRLYRGEGLLSMAHAFRYAGARNVVASLWTVDDASSPFLITSFFENLSEHNDPAKAMSLAKQSFIRNHRIKAHPYYWAGFTTWGIVSNANGLKTRLVVISGAGVLLLLAGLVFRKKLLRITEKITAK